MRKSNMPAVSAAAFMAAAAPGALLGSVMADASGTDIEKLFAEVKVQLKEVGDATKQTAENALKEAKDSGAVSAEVKAAADKLLTDQNKLTAAFEGLENKLEALETRGLDLEQKIAAGLGGGKEPRATLGQSVVNSDEFKAFAAAGARGSCQVGVQAAITSADGSAGDLIVPDRETEIIGLPRRQLTIRQLLMPGRTESNLVEYAKQTVRTNAAAPVAEGAAKPESDLVWDKADAPVRTIAHTIPVSRQAMDDAQQLQTLIDSEMRNGLDLVEETQLLVGSGAGENLSGLVTEATAYAAAFAPDAPQIIDTLRLALLQASLAEFPADGIVLHPTDWARIELTKDANENYMFANVMQLAGPSLWGQPVVATQSMTLDEFLVGAFRMAAQIYDRMDTEVLISSENSDNFVKNMLTVRAEKRLALAVKRAAALITGDFGFVA